MSFVKKSFFQLLFSEKVISLTSEVKNHIIEKKHVISFFGCLLVTLVSLSLLFPDSGNNKPDANYNNNSFNLSNIEPAAGDIVIYRSHDLIYDDAFQYDTNDNIFNNQAKQISQEQIELVAKELRLSGTKKLNTGVVLIPSINTPSISKQAWIKNAVPTDRNIKNDTPKIAIIIDDMGVNKKMSEAIMSIKGPLTLSFLPYASGIREMSQIARKRGHEIMMHIPMEPLNSNENLGTGALFTSMSKQEIISTLESNFGKLNGFVGINNHMGSKFTQDAKSMRVVVSKLKESGYLFVDSKTIGNSVAKDIAANGGIAYASRDLFIDHYDDYKSANESMAQLVEKAKEKGSAIAIGHPKINTIRALYEWIPKLESMGVALVPVSAIVNPPKATDDNKLAMNK